MSDMDNHIVLEGKISVCEALEAKNREIISVWINENKKSDRRAIGEIAKLAAKNDVPIYFKAADEIEKHTFGKTCGGIIAFASERRFLTISEMYSLGDTCRWVALEGFEDPYNYGNAVRSLYAAGFNGLLTSRKHWNKADTLLLKSSAGASEKMPTSLIKNYDETIGFLKSAGFTIVCAEQSSSSVSLYDLEISPPYLVVIGGEKRGIAKSFIENACDHFTIPYGKNVNYALSGASAAAIIAFEILRKSTK